MRAISLNESARLAPISLTHIETMVQLSDEEFEAFMARARRLAPPFPEDPRYEAWLAQRRAHSEHP